MCPSIPVWVWIVIGISAFLLIIIAIVMTALYIYESKPLHDISDSTVLMSLLQSVANQ